MEPEGIQEATEDQEGQHDEVEGQNDRKSFSELIVWDYFLMLSLETNPSVVSSQGSSMHKSIKDIVPGQTVPKSHHQHVNKICQR